MGKNSGGSFLLGLLVGAMAGAAVALLLTPQSGEELRRTLEQKSIEVKDNATRLAEDAKTQAQRQVEYVQEQGRIVVSDTVRKAQQVVGDSQTKVTTGDATAAPPAADPA